jgi:hypothetical protein
MRSLRPAACRLAFGLSVVVGCGSDDAAFEDPGRPAVTYGPRCSLGLEMAPVPRLDQCTAIATIRGDLAHLYLDLYPDRHPTDMRRYASIVVRAREWAPRVFTEAVGGRIEVGFGDGKTYRLVATRDAPFPIDLKVSDAILADGGDHYYLRGELGAVLPGVSGTSGQVGFRAVINTPTN